MTSHIALHEMFCWHPETRHLYDPLRTPCLRQRCLTDLEVIVRHISTLTAPLSVSFFLRHCRTLFYAHIYFFQKNSRVLESLSIMSLKLPRFRKDNRNIKRVFACWRPGLRAESQLALFMLGCFLASRKISIIRFNFRRTHKRNSLKNWAPWLMMRLRESPHH